MYINDYILHDYIIIDIYLCKCIMYRHIGPSPFPHPMPSFRKKSQDTVASALDVNQPGIQNQIWNLESGNFCGMMWDDFFGPSMTFMAFSPQPPGRGCPDPAPSSRSKFLSLPGNEALGEPAV